MSNEGTVAIMAAFFVSVIGVDVWLAMDGKKGNTYSERLREWGKKWPPIKMIILFAMGLLAGHWWWSPVEVVTVPAAQAQDAGPVIPQDAGKTP